MTLRTVAVALLAALAFSSCSSGVQPSADSKIFAGLNRPLVEEVLQNPKAQANVQDLTPQEAPSMWQGMVQNFAICREATRVYLEWQKSGSAPKVARSQPPSNPEQPSADDAVRAWEYYEKLAKQGDIEQLRQALTSESSCGAWIPAKPGDIKGPTIADTLKK